MAEDIAKCTLIALIDMSNGSEIEDKVAASMVEAIVAKLVARGLVIRLDGWSVDYDFAVAGSVYGQSTYYVWA